MNVFENVAAAMVKHGVIELLPSSGHLRAVIYCRVSADEQAENGDSLGRQVAACRKYAAEQGLTLADGHIYTDDQDVPADLLVGDI